MIKLPVKVFEEARNKKLQIEKIKWIVEVWN